MKTDRRRSGDLDRRHCAHKRWGKVGQIEAAGYKVSHGYCAFTRGAEASVSTIEDDQRLLRSPYHTQRVAVRAANAVLIFAVAFCSFLLNSWRNDFPLGFHPDEPGKAAQLRDRAGFRNFNHPLLLLEITDAASHAVSWSSATDTVRAGRFVSAGLVALAVLVSTVLAAKQFGLKCGVIVGVLLATCPQLVVVSHYFKEDAALTAASLATVSYGVYIHSKHQSQNIGFGQLIVLGMLCGAAGSAKYIGFLFVALCAILVWHMMAGRATHKLFVCAVLLFVAILTFACINVRAFAHLDQVGARVNAELALAMEGRRNVTLVRPNSYYLRILLQSAGPELVVIGVVFWMCRQQATTCKGELTPLIAAALYVVVVSSSGNAFPRYALPATALVFLSMALLCARLISSQQKPQCARPVRALVIVILGFQAVASLRAVRAFAEDSRLLVRRWVATQLPNDVTLAADNYACLRVVTGSHVPHLSAHVIESSFFVADLCDTPEELSSWGVTHVVVTDSTLLRLFDRSAAPAPGAEQLFARRRRWYETLFKEYPVVWKSGSTYPWDPYCDPEVSVYCITRQR